MTLLDDRAVRTGDPSEHLALDGQAQDLLFTAARTVNTFTDEPPSTTCEFVTGTDRQTTYLMRISRAHEKE